MDNFTLEELKSLLAVRHDGCVSLYMPAHRRGRDAAQDPIRFKNLLRQAEENLQGKGWRAPEVREALAPAQRLLQDGAFWRRQSDGLAVFVGGGECRPYRLPLRFDELVRTADRFHLKPILPLFTGNGRFSVLALSQKQVRLLRGTRYTMDEVQLPDLTAVMAEAPRQERAEKQLQFHTGTSAGGGERAAMFHGHDPSDDEKGRILRWFQKLDGELARLLAGERSPLVLAGVEHLFPLYRQANTYPHLIEEGIPGNPEEASPEQLHARAWPLVQSIFMAQAGAAAARYRQLAGTGQATADVPEAVLAAHHGRVEVLFVATGLLVWGGCDPGANTASVHPEPAPGDEDLLDLAAIQTILNGGTVYAVAPDQVPEQAPLAAVLRY